MSRAARRNLTAAESAEAQRLKSIWTKRKQADRTLTQQRAGETMGITQGAVWQYLNGRIPLGTDALLRFARCLDFDPAEVRPGFNLANNGSDQPSTVSFDVEAVEKQIQAWSRDDRMRLLKAIAELEARLAPD